MNGLAREVVPFTTEEAWLAERAKDLTSTDIASLFGLQGPGRPTRFELYHRKVSGRIVRDDVDNERAEIGRAMEGTIAGIAARRNGWALQPKKAYMRIPGLRVGSSFDYESVEPAFLVECKNVDGYVFKTEWLATDFGLEAPAAIELQAQHQCLVADVPVCVIVALVGGNRLVKLERNADPAVHDAILRECEKFFASGEPEPDFMQDAETIARLMGYAEPGKLIEATPEVEALAREYIGHATAKSQAEKAMAATKARLLREIGDAERVLSPEFTLSAKVVKGGHVEYDRGEYRSFRVFSKADKHAD